MNVQDARAQVVDVHDRLKSVRDDLARLARDVEGAPVEIRQHMDSLAVRAHAFGASLSEMAEALEVL